MAYTVNGVADRIKTMDFDAFAWKRYTALCTLAHIRATPKKVVVMRVFNGAKESSSFKGAWTIASNFFAAFVSTEEQTAIRDMDLDAASDRAVELIQAHMDTLGVKGKNEYALVAKYATKEALTMAQGAEKQRLEDEAAAKEIADKAAAEIEAAKEAAAVMVATVMPERNIVADALETLATATNSDLCFVVAKLLPAIETDDLAAIYLQLGEMIANKRKVEDAAVLLPKAEVVVAKKGKTIKTLADLANAA